MPPILRSRSWWADYHRRRTESRRRRTAAPSTAEGELGLLHDQHPIYTFTPQRLAPLVTVTHNDGTRVTTASGPCLVQPLPAPAIKRSSKAAGTKATSLIAQRAQAILDARPTADELLIAQLTAGPRGRKRQADPCLLAASKRSKT
ncbi:hypothetical protein B0H11DRAFT_2259132 [Mycena galericulata]|nr:hypothetical protein B0H11DRAFT_2259132 [Mycena galericulata]